MLEIIFQTTKKEEIVKTAIKIKKELKPIFTARFALELKIIRIGVV